MAEEVKPNEGEQETDATSELGDAGKRALDAERKARRAAEKRLSELEAKVKEAEDAEKTELQRLQDKVAELEGQARDAESRAARFEVAAAKGLSLAQARRLVGATKEELEQDADEMRAELGLKNEENEETSTEETQEQGLGARPKEDLKSGASNAGDEEPDPAKLADSILKTSW